AAARQGHRDAQVSIATQYYLGRGITQDYAKSAYWYRKAAVQGDVGAQYLLASQYEHGLGVAVDWREAVRWYARAGAQGDRAALLKAQALQAEHASR
ncbi:MAG: sel1 repeat family protein, partial [Aquitalea sp.]|nr:sel1 repeat family protein [Aquitalea sp.]